MEKHSAYCALMRLGLKVPETILVPYKNPVDNVRWAYTSARYNRPFDLKQIANELGYPLYMGPSTAAAGEASPGSTTSRTSCAPTTHRARCSCTCRRRSTTTSSPGPVHRPGDGDELPPGRADAQPLRRQPRLPQPARPGRRRRPSAGSSMPCSAGSSTRARCSSRATRSTPSTTPTRAQTWPSPRCTTTSPGPSRRSCAGLPTASSPADAPEPSASRRGGTRRGGPRGPQRRGEARRISRDRRQYFETTAYDKGARGTWLISAAALEWFKGEAFHQMLRTTVDLTYPEHERDRFMAHFQGLLGLWVRDEETAGRPTPAVCR